MNLDHPPPPPPPRRPSTVARRYWKARVANLVGSFAEPRAFQQALVRRLTDLLDRPARKEPAAEPATPPPTWAEARARYRWSPALLRRRYREHAALARWTLPAALASLGIGVICWGLGDGSGGLASLSAALLLLVLGLRPAYRCWSIRRRTLGGFSDFLRRPQAWWPPPLPDDYTP